MKLESLFICNAALSCTLFFLTVNSSLTIFNPILIKKFNILMFGIRLNIGNGMSYLSTWAEFLLHILIH